VIVVMSLPPIAFSAGSLLSTVEDMAKWDAALYTEKLLKKSSLAQMWTAAVTVNGADPPFNYSLGWIVDSYHNHWHLWHTGGNPRRHPSRQRCASSWARQQTRHFGNGSPSTVR